MGGAVQAKPHAASRDLTRRFVTLENDHNPAHKGDSKTQRLESYLIPIEHVEWVQLENFPTEIAKHLFVTDADGNWFYRWIIHPDDTRYREQVADDLRSYFNLPSGAPLKSERHFVGYRTASRSLIVIDPLTDYAFSMKTSTNYAGGHWTDKVQPVRYAESSIIATEHLVAVQKIYGEFSYALPLYESGAVYNRFIDQAQIFRQLGDMNDGKTLLMPGFASLSQEVMDQLIEANKMTLAEVVQHLGYLWGRAQAEWTLKSGLSTSSAHFQNFVFELTPQMKFTGRVGFRDYADAHVMGDFVNGPIKERLIRHWSGLNDQNNLVFKRNISLSFMPYHGLNMVIEGEVMHGIFKGAKQGMDWYLNQTLGPWVFSQWKYQQVPLEDGVGILTNYMPPKDFDYQGMMQRLAEKKITDCNILLAR